LRATAQNKYTTRYVQRLVKGFAIRADIDRNVTGWEKTTFGLLRENARGFNAGGSSWSASFQIEPLYSQDMFKEASLYWFRPN